MSNSFGFGGHNACLLLKKVVSAAVRCRVRRVHRLDPPVCFQVRLANRAGADNAIVAVLGGPVDAGASMPSPAYAVEPSAARNCDRILRLEVPVIVQLAERKLTLAEVMRLGAGAIIEFSKSNDEPLELLINNKPIGVGEAVKVGENFGLRITQIGDVKQVIRSMGGSH